MQMMRSVQRAHFRKTAQDSPPHQMSHQMQGQMPFTPRSLVEIAFEAERRRTPTPAPPPPASPLETAANPALDTGAQIPASPIFEPPQEEPPQKDEDKAAQKEDKKTCQKDEKDAAQNDEKKDAFYVAAEAAGYERGFADGKQAVQSHAPTPVELEQQAAHEAERETLIATFKQAIAAAADPAHIDTEQLFTHLNAAVLQLASERAGMAITDNPAPFIARIRQLIAHVKQAAAQITITLCPSDLKAVQTILPAAQTPDHWVWQSGDDLRAGDLRIQLGDIEIIDILSDAPLPLFASLPLSAPLPLVEGATCP